MNLPAELNDYVEWTSSDCRTLRLKIPFEQWDASAQAWSTYVRPLLLDAAEFNEPQGKVRAALCHEVPKCHLRGQAVDDPSCPYYAGGLCSMASDRLTLSSLAPFYGLDAPGLLRLRRQVIKQVLEQFRDHPDCAAYLARRSARRSPATP